MIHNKEYLYVAATYNNLGLVYQKTEQHRQAKYFLEKALSMYKVIYAEEHADVATTSYHNLALVYCIIGDYNHAKVLKEKTLKIQKKIYGEDHAHVESSCFDLELIKTVMENTVKPKGSGKKKVLRSHKKPT